MSWALLPLGKPQECATHDCRGAAAWELEVGGIGSTYCNTCKTIIERGQKYSDGKLVIVSPPDDSYVKQFFVGEHD